jgi:transketolase
MERTMSTTTDQLAADSIRVLAMDAVQRANSGHPGMPMGMADLAVVVWSKFLSFDPADPTWPDRDRFVLSNGHGSMLLYSLLHLTGFGLSMDDLRNFRQWGSPTAGHPERDPELGIELTTGPLGQGFGTGVGMAIAEAHLRAVFGPELVDHHIYGFVSDGDLMEGVASEAASLAGHLALGKLLYLYDDNLITIDGSTDLAYTEDAAARFRAYGWHTLSVDGHDRPAIEEAVATAVAVEDRPSLVLCRTHIAYGAPNKQDSSSAHGSPLGDDEIAATKEGMGWTLPPFEVPDEVYEFFAAAAARGQTARHDWEERREAAFASDGELAARWQSYCDPQPVALTAPDYEPGSSVATRQISGDLIGELSRIRPDVIGGSADLTPSNNTLIAESGDFSASNRAGRYLRFGIREHAMGAAINGITLHGGLRGYGGTFLQFSDYMRPAVRLGALMDVPSIWVWTHDSIFLGEDGPTHQPIEHLAALRAIPNLWVIRPGDPTEVAVAWETAMNRLDGPTALILSRQGVPVPGVAPDPALVARGGYVRRPGNDAVLVATGSEVGLAEAAAAALYDRGRSIRVVSLPCVEAFAEQTVDYRRLVLGEGLPVASVEAGATFGWQAITGRDGLRIGIDRYGASAPASVLAEEFGLTPDAVADRVERWLQG